MVKLKWFEGSRPFLTVLKERENTMDARKEKSFETFLMEKHSKQYIGTDDDMIDDFNNWVCRLDIEEVIKYAEEWHQQER